MKPCIVLSFLVLVSAALLTPGCGQASLDPEDVTAQDTELADDGTQSTDPVGEQAGDEGDEGDEQGSADESSGQDDSGAASDQGDDESSDEETHDNGVGEGTGTDWQGTSTDCAGILDAATGLCWQDPSYFGAGEAGIMWADAVAYCDALELDGQGDWRMPNVDEVRTIVRGCPSTQTDGACTIVDGSPDTMFSEACDGCSQFAGPNGGCYWAEGFSGQCPGNVWLWTSSESVDAGIPFFYDPSVARLGRTFDVFPMAVRCVRN